MMQRRSFLQSLAAALATPVLGCSALRLSVPTIQWNQWVDPLAMRYNLAKPFVMNGFTYATDGRKLIRTLGDCELVDAEKSKRPDISVLPWDLFDSGGWRDLKFSNDHCESECITCNKCCGLGRIGNDLVWDDDEGDDLFWDNKTGWKGGVECELCQGSGGIDCGFCYLVDGWNFDPGILQPVVNLGNVEYKLDSHPDYASGITGFSAVMLFRCEDVQGFVAGRTARRP